MTQPSGDTIVALASASGPGARAVLRLSGPRSAELVAACCRDEQGQALPPAERGLALGQLHDGVGTQPLLLLWMPGPGSYTREDVAELHLPGNPHLVRVALERLLALGARAAQRGEFTRRAFENGRLDLTRAEGVLALVQASSRAERRAATALLLGGLERRLVRLRGRLDELRSLTEASLDFDEADTGHVPERQLLELGREALAELREAEGWEQARAAAPGAPRAVLAGRPNAGKSSLFNALVGGEQRALVSETAGSTRDVLAGPWTVAGVELRLEDSAGRRGAGVDVLERGAQDLAQRAAQGADLVLWLARAEADPGAPPAEPSLREGLLVWSQVDRPDVPAEPPPDWRTAFPRWVATSARAGLGLGELEQAVAEALGLRAEAQGQAVGGGELSARHRAALAAAAGHLERALAELEAGQALDWVAETLREASSSLDEIHGRTTPEDLLDRIFASFCLGK